MFLTKWEFLSKIRSESVNYEWVETRKRRAVSYTLNVPAAFDIETTTFQENNQNRAIMYHWQFGINTHITCGRTWEEYESLMGQIAQILDLNDEKKKMLVFVHNLPYEFQWIRKHFFFDKVFILDRRKPVYATNGGIEYRCSMKLAGGRSLEAVGKELIHHSVRKLKGDLDYSLMRSPLTPMTEKELAYCENDIAVLLAYIFEKIEQDGDITQIPLTNTGYVRRLVKKSCFKRWRNYKPIMKMLTLTAGAYVLLRRAYRGGAVHCSPRYSPRFSNLNPELPFVKSLNVKTENWITDVISFDFASSYPACALLKQFPMGPPIHVPDDVAKENFDYFLQNYCCVFDWSVSELRPHYDKKRQELTDYESPLSASKCWNDVPEWKTDKLRNRGYVGAEIANGRIIKADRINTTITELDYDTYSKFYDWDGKSEQIRNLVVFEKGRLPHEIISPILYLYEQKTKLKGVEGKELEYMIAKNMLNAIYGMMCTNIIRAEWGYDDEKSKFLDPVQPDLETKIEEYNKKRDRFLYYPWGVWITAHARHNLYEGILAVGRDYVYSDTDSIKILHAAKHLAFIHNYNAQIKKETKIAARYYGEPVERFAPNDKNGKAHPIGVWDFDGAYKRFSSLGAKRYLVECYGKGRKKRDNTTYMLTVAGTNKRLALEYLAEYDKSIDDRDDKGGPYIPVKYCKQDPFTMFKDGAVIPPEKSGRLSLSYEDNETEGYFVDYMGQEYHYHEYSSVSMIPTTYELGLSEDFKDFILTHADNEYDELSDMTDL